MTAVSGDHGPAARDLEALAAAVAAIGGRVRTGQQEMVEAVVDALDGGAVGVIQAGTGTGKSLAYLIPVLRRAQAEEHRAIISTSTLALQRQLVTKDVPVACAAVAQTDGLTPQVAVLKGWQNYVCRARVGSSDQPDDLDETLWGPPEGHGGTNLTDQGREALRVQEWSQTTDTGDRDDLTPGVSDRVWRAVSVNRLACAGRACSWWEDCFAVQARRRADEADVVITNHTLLGLAAAGNDRVLPEHATILIDEAHDMVARVTAATTIDITPTGVQRLAAAARRAGVVGSAAAEQAASALAESLVGVEAGRVAQLPAPVTEALAAVRDAARDLTSGARELASASRGGSGAPPANGTSGGEAAGTADARGLVRLTRVEAQAAQIFDHAEALLGADDGMVVWVARDRDGAVSVAAAALDVSQAIRSRVLGERHAVLTSATLDVGGRPEPIARSWGLSGPPGSKWHATRVTSPFNYVAQAILYTAAHLPRPGREGPSPELLEELAALIEASGGGALGLFSSRRAATVAAEYVRNRVGTTVLCQGDASLTGLIGQFVTEPDTSLFGSLSMWQGVDAPGATCRLVVVDRIPFARPDDPAASARAARADAHGGSGFRDVSLPAAALLLAQGAGRLVRSEDDRGVLAVLDPRLVSAPYGRVLRASLPPMWPTTDPEVVRGALRRLQSAQH